MTKPKRYLIGLYLLASVFWLALVLYVQAEDSSQKSAWSNLALDILLPPVIAIALIWSVARIGIWALRPANRIVSRWWCTPNVTRRREFATTWIVANWFRLGIMAAVWIAALSVASYFRLFLPQHRNQKYSYRPIEPREVLAAVPEGYRLAQAELDGDKTDVLYATAHLEDAPGDVVILLLEWKRLQGYVSALYPSHPVLVQAMKFSRESDQWRVYTTLRLYDETNIRFSYIRIQLQGHPNEAIVVVPYSYGYSDIVSDADGQPVSVKENATMHQKVAILTLENGEFVHLTDYTFGPKADNVTHSGGIDCLDTSPFYGAIDVAEPEKSATAPWTGCHRLIFTRYVFQRYPSKVMRFFMRHFGVTWAHFGFGAVIPMSDLGQFVKAGEFLTVKKYTQTSSCDRSGAPQLPTAAESAECCTYIIYSGSAKLEEHFPDEFEVKRPRVRRMVDFTVIGKRF